jgi:hypothetical protein
MNSSDLVVFAELMWLLKHTPPSVGFNRKPLTIKQQKVVEDIYDLITYPDNYSEELNRRNGQ